MNITNDLSSPNPPLAFFQNRLQRFLVLSSKLKSRLKRISRLRIFFFFLPVGVSFVIYLFSLPSWLYLVSLFFVFPFVYFVIHYQKTKNYSRKVSATYVWYQKELLRIEGKWKLIRTREFWEYPKDVQNHPLSVDLDLCTKQGFFGVFDQTATKQGFDQFLYQFLEGRSSNANLREFLPRGVQRSEATNAIPNFTYHFLRKIQNPDLEPPEKWDVPKVSPNFSFWENRKLLGFIFRLYSLFSLLYISIALLFSLPFVPILLLANGFLFWTYRKESLRYWQEIQKESATAVLFERSVLFLSQNKKKTKRMLSEIQSLGSASELTISLLPHLILNLLVFWDLWKLKKYENWKRDFDNDWLTIWNQILVLDSRLSYDHLQFLYPETERGTLSQENFLQATKLRHPLLPIGIAVRNPLPYVKPGDLVLITGSNMSGKTTYLRSIALNLLLSSIQAPSFAQNLEFPKFQLYTLIRSQDSLEDGVSFFYSEVRRLAMIIREADKNDFTPILFLDEILKGTNSKERFIATREVLKELRKKKAIVFVTTHDLKLSEIPWAKTFHFTELEVQGEMVFDYKLREGVATTTNALKILKKEGIPIQNESEED